MKANVLKRRSAFFSIVETDIVETDIAFHAHSFFRDIPSWLNRFIDDLEHALAGRASGLHQLIELMQFINRFIQKSREHKKADEVTRLHDAAQHCSRAHPKGKYNSDRTDEIHRWVINRPDPHHDERRLTELVADRIESAVLFALAHETLDLPDAGEVVVEERVHRRGGAALKPIPPMSRQRVPKRAAGQERHWRQSHERQRGADVKHHPENNHELKHSHDSLLDSIDQHALDGSHILEDACH